MGVPAQVYIIRHGEKLGDPSDDRGGGRDLSIRGAARAVALTSLFAPAQYQTDQLSCALATPGPCFAGSYVPVTIPGTRPRFATPDFIVATSQSRHSNRPVETIAPLKSALRLSEDHFDDTRPDDEYSAVASDILTAPKYADKVVLICWHHGKIPALAAKLGIDPQPSRWLDDVFDLVWQITWPGGRAGLTVHRQMLVYGDSTG